MAKELLIVFVYDCEMCKSEEDDPEKAIIYFYPTWVNREQRHALCSQLMGVTQFSRSTFSNPRIISLQSGKFSMRRLGRYFLCVGTDRNIPDIVLETRSKILYKLIRLFHYDIELLQASLPASEEENVTLSDKLTELFHIYMPILQYATNIFGNIPTFKLPKSASSLFLQAMHILQNLQRIPGVLGGVFLQQNKVIVTQLSYQLTKQFVVTDPYRIKLPADTVHTQFHLPLGVQLISVYVDKKEVGRLKEDIVKLHEAITQLPEWRKDLEQYDVKIKDMEGGMKKSKSTMFTVPEEGSTLETINDNEPGSSDQDASTSKKKESPKKVPDVVRDAVKARHMARIKTIKPAEFMLSQPAELPRAATTDNLSSTNRIPMRYYSLGLSKVEDDWVSSKDKEPMPRPYYNTIADPKYPLFKPDGLPCSASRYGSSILNKLTSLKQADEDSTSQKPRPKSIILDKDLSPTEKKPERPKRDFKLNLTQTSDETVASVKKQNQSLALTPLMAKLSLLANEADVCMDTPLSSRPFPVKTPAAKTPKAKTPCPSKGPTLVPWVESPPDPSGAKPLDPAVLADKPTRRRRTFSDYERDELTHSVLYVFGQNNTVILLLLELETATNPEHIHYLWENCVGDVTEYQEKLTRVLEATEPNGGGPDTSYSYLLVDPGWGPTDRAGAYRPHHIQLLTDLHHSLNINPQMTDITLRTEDTVSYGYQCAGRQVYYQESCNAVGGLPPPTDPMGVVPVKARRRLQRDHNILIL